MNVIEMKLIANIEECNLHIQRMISAFVKMRELIPLKWEKFSSLNEDEIEHIDQLLFRFSKLQDVMGKKLFKNLMEGISEYSKELTFIDILNRLEELRLLEKNDWLKLRKIRNLISHEYPEEKLLAMENLNDLFEYIKVIYKTFINCKGFILEKIISNENKSSYLTVAFPERGNE